MAEKILPPIIEPGDNANGTGHADTDLRELQERFEALGRELLRHDPVALVVSANALRREAQAVSAPGLGANHPLVSLAGVYKNDAAFDSLMERIGEYRKEIDAAPEDEEKS
jgi:hypothetical protein